MSAYFFDMLEGLHRWCVMGQGQTYPSQLLQVQSWLNEHLPSPPETEADWLEQWRTPVSDWWPMTLPADWESAWRLLSRQEATLTVEALMYLDAHRPGVPAAMLALPVAPARSTASSLAMPEMPSLRDWLDDEPTLPDVEPSARWNMQDLVMCVAREVARRERVYPQLIHQRRLSPDEAEQELSQMRSLRAYLLAKLKAGDMPQQQVLF